MFRALPTPLRFLTAILVGMLCAIGFSVVVYVGVQMFHRIPQVH